MKILIIQVGNPVIKSCLDTKISFLQFPTLLHGTQYFDQKQIINNVQTRESIQKAGNIVDFYFHTNRKSFIDLLLSSWQIRKLSKIIKPDITHIYWGGISGLLAVLFVKGKSVISLLGSDLFGTYMKEGNGAKTKSSWIQTYSSRMTALIANRTIVMSKGMKDFLWNSNSKNVNVIPEGISLQKFYKINKVYARSHLGWNTNSKIVIFFYEGQEVKNASLANSTIGLIEQRIPELEFKIISGYKHEELVNVYNAADCMLITSYHEGSNNSVKEAMACNLPVVSVPCGDSPERLRNLENCYVSQKYDAAELADAAINILDSGKRSNGRYFTEQLSLSNVADQIIEVYKKVLEK